MLDQIALRDEQAPISLDDLWLKLRGAEWVREGRMEQQLIESHVLFVMKAGVGRLAIDMREYQLRPDTAYVALPGQTIGVAVGTTDGLELCVIRFDMRRDSQPDALFGLKGEIPIYPDSRTVSLCEQVYAYGRSEQALERFRGQSAFQELLYSLFKHVRLLPETDSRTALDRTKAYIESHYNESLSIEQLARMAEISPKYYVELFKKSYGISTIDYVTEVRINRAKQLMVRSDVRLRDIAHRVGYHDEFYFSRKFKQQVGVSPTAYVKNRRRKIAAYSSPIIGQLLALNVIPYAAPLHPKWTAYYHKMYRSDIPLHLSAYRFNQDWESNVEALVQARPDLVICTDQLYPDEKARLERELPVFYIPWEETDWREQLRLTARLLGAAKEAEAWLRGYDRKTLFARGRLQREWGNETVLAMSIFKQSCYFCPTRGMRDVLYGDLRLKSAPGFEPAAYNRVMTADQLALFDPDRILVNVCQEPESLRYWQWLQTSPLWRDLKAVRRNHVHAISSDPWREYSASASERMVDGLLQLLDGTRHDASRPASVSG